MIKFRVYDDTDVYEFDNYSAAQVFITENNMPESAIKEITETIVVDHALNIRNNILGPAIAYGKDLAENFASENVMMGITATGKTKLIADTLRNVTYYLQSGSLYEAIREAESLVLTPSMAPFLTPARVKLLTNKMRAYIGLPQL